MNLPLFRIDIPYFLEQLATSADRSEGTVFAEEQEALFQHGDPFLTMRRFFVEDRMIIRRGRVPLMQDTIEGSVLSLFNMDTFLPFGYIFYETGFQGSSGNYEAIKLRTHFPLHLQDGKVLPQCTIKYVTGAEHLGDAPKPERKDHRRVLIGWRETNLEHLIPTSWFCRNGNS